MKILRKILPPSARDFILDSRTFLNRLTRVDIMRFDSRNPVERRHQLLQRNAVSTVLDVGANRGQFAGQLRRHGYKGMIHSFEPLSSAFALLQKKAQVDTSWFVHNLALGEADGTGEINISSNSQSSSLLPMTDIHISADRSSHYTGSEAIEVRSLDSIYNSLEIPDSVVFLKIDAQGMEQQVINGASETLQNIAFVQAELSFTSLYKGETLFTDFAATMKQRGFRIVFVDQAFTDHRTMFGLQCDVIFFRGE